MFFTCLISRLNRSQNVRKPRSIVVIDRLNTFHWLIFLLWTFKSEKRSFKPSIGFGLVEEISTQRRKLVPPHKHLKSKRYCRIRLKKKGGNNPRLKPHVWSFIIALSWMKKTTNEKLWKCDGATNRVDFREHISIFGMLRWSKFTISSPKRKNLFTLL